MAQTKRSSSSRSASGRSTSRKATGRNGSSRTSRSRSTSRNGRSRATTRRTAANGPVSKTTGKVAAIASKAAPDTATVRKTGERVSDLASKAKTPLLAGGAALAGLAGGIALKSRTESKRPTKRFRAVQLPKSLRNIDLEQVIEAGRRVRSIGDQVGDVADTADKTRKKH
jgi:hypothetical protein